MSLMREVFVNGKKITLDSELMMFSEHTLSNYIETEGGYYDYYGAILAEAEKEMWTTEHHLEILYSEAFKRFKEDGATEKLAESSAKASEEVQDAKKVYLEAKHTVRMLQQHLKAWDKNHENAQSRGHFLRKEMDKLNRDIYLTSEDKVDEIVTSVE